MKAKIIVTPKRSVLDPQGEAVRRAIHSLGMECIEAARIGKYIELEITGKDVELTREKLEPICRDLLSNPVVEDYELEVLSEHGQAGVKQKKEKKEKKDKSKKKKKKEKKKDKKGKK